jgi:IS605 OrfB family transposase
MATVTKTHRNFIDSRPHLTAWYEVTKTLYNQVVAFYFELYQLHPGLLELSQKEALRQAEQLTHRTKDNPTPLILLAEAISVNIPALLRRAAINAARGAFRSFASHLTRWRKEKAKFEAKGKTFHKRPPVPPRMFNFNLPFYKGLFKERTERSIMVYLYSGSSWQWVKLRLRGEPLPEGWEAGSPTLIRRGKQFRLHTPLEKQIEKPQKVLEQVANNPHLRVCAVDLNMTEALAVCTILAADGTEVATRFIGGGRELHARRKRLLGKVAANRRKTGIVAEGEQDNKALWRKIRAIDENEAHRISRRIVDFAVENGASILVFEHLGKLRPQKGCYSKRSNQKRAYWLKGKIVTFSRYKAWEYGLLTCRVNSAYTSQRCAVCGYQPVARYAAGEAPLEYRVGAPLYFCPDCLRRGNADRNASVNIGLRFFIRSMQHLSQSLSLKEGGVLPAHVPKWQFQPGEQNGLALPRVSLAQLRLTGRGYAAGTGEFVYAGVLEDAQLC